MTLQRSSIGPVTGRRTSDSGCTAVPVTFTASPGPSVRRQCDEWIVAGAFSRRLLAAGLSCRGRRKLPRGSVHRAAEAEGQPTRNLSAPRQVSAIVKAIRAAANQSGGEMARLEVHRPHGVAVALVVASHDPASFLKTKLRKLMVSLDRQCSRLETVPRGSGRNQPARAE
jgi:hypothetical protein